MSRFYKTNQGGFIQWVIIIIVVILILSYFSFDLRGLVDDPQTQDNFSVVWEFIVRVWEDYLEAPATWLWENIFTFIWNDLFLDNLYRLQNGENIRDLAPGGPTTP